MDDLRREMGCYGNEEFMADQPDAEAAKQRFEQWDAGEKGLLSREEFINMNGKSK